MANEARQGPYSRKHHSWIVELCHAHCGRIELLVMDALCERLEFDRWGNASAWYPRAEMAQELGLTENQIRDAVTGLKKKGLVKVKSQGHNGHATVYSIMPSHPWKSVKGTRPPKPTEHSDNPPRPEGLGEQDLKGSVPPNPLRHKGDVALAARIAELVGDAE